MDCVEAFLGDFAVDDLLDLSNTEAFVSEESSWSLREEEEEKQEQEQEGQKAKSFSDQTVCISPIDDLLSLPSSELEFPVGDLEDLEWLSNFVDDSISESYPPGDFPVNTVPSVEVKRHCIPVKPRSKRRRTNGRIWSLESTSSFLSTAVISGTGKKKRGRKKVETSSSGDGGGVQQPRRCCSHCGVQKTPQWRMGPLGVKTLCNACGVRFKSGRLLPEYRPACSPTFLTKIHSNSHRKVLELRLKKNTADPGVVSLLIKKKKL